MKNYLYISLCVAALFSLFSCQQPDEITTSSDARLEFELDTLRFDTVFTELGSATRYFKVYNRNDRAVVISRVYLEGENNSFFRMNVDGDPGNVQEDVLVLANDSIYVFAEVTVDPDQPLSASPFVINENLVFETNDNVQRVVLEAWGQNANYFPSRFNKGVPTVLTCNNQEVIWDDPKPYVIYGEIFIDSCMLTVMEGTKIYVHGGVARNDVFGTFNDGILYTLQRGKLNFKGTLEKPIIIQGDRLETPFQDDPGQWFGIIIGRGSRGSNFEHTIIKNSNIGVYVDSAGSATLKNAQIYNTAGSGILAYSSSVTAENTLIYNNFGNSVQLIKGGNYKFTYCTFASYGVDASALAMSNFFCFDDVCNDFQTNRLNAEFINSIIFGSSSDEIILSDAFEGDGFLQFEVNFRNCIVKVEDLLEQQDGLYADFIGDQCNPCINATRRDTLFVNPSDDDYHLDTLSIAEGPGQLLEMPIGPPNPILIDLEGKNGGMRRIRILGVV
jgi:hypothetical protein